MIYWIANRTIYNILLYLYLNFTFFIKWPYKQTRRDGAPLHLVKMIAKALFKRTRGWALTRRRIGGGLIFVRKGRENARREAKVELMLFFITVAFLFSTIYNALCCCFGGLHGACCNKSRDEKLCRHEYALLMKLGVSPFDKKWGCNQINYFVTISYTIYFLWIRSRPSIGRLRIWMRTYLTANSKRKCSRLGRKQN
jgi:hypothetical protein